MENYTICGHSVVFDKDFADTFLHEINKIIKNINKFYVKNNFLF